MTNIKDYLKMVITAVTCFVMNLIPENKSLFADLSAWMKEMGFRLVETSPRTKLINTYIMKNVNMKDMEAKKKNLQTETNPKEHRHNKKIIYWNEPRIQRRINKIAYFHTG